MEDDIANQALHFAMAWGEDWLKPTQPRMKVLHPELSDEQLNEYDVVARAVMSLGTGYLYDAPQSEYPPFVAMMRGRYPWASDDNLSRLFSLGQYYASK